MNLVVKRYKTHFFSIFMFLVGIGIGGLSIKEILSGDNIFKELIFLLVIAPLFLVPLINDIKSYMKFGKILLEANEEKIICINNKTHKSNEILRKDILGVFNRKSSRGVLGVVGIVVDKKYEAYGTPIIFNSKTHTIEFNEENYNSIFIEINTNNSKLDNTIICEKIGEYIK